MAINRAFHQETAGLRSRQHLLGALAAVAILLAAVGVYGVVAYTFNRRRREIGIRLAVGATQPMILRMILCAVDGSAHVQSMMSALHEVGIVTTRMGAYKPRTSPYDFQGLGRACLPYVFDQALPTPKLAAISEATSSNHGSAISSKSGSEHRRGPIPCSSGRPGRAGQGRPVLVRSQTRAPRRHPAAPPTTATSKAVLSGETVRLTAVPGRGVGAGRGSRGRPAGRRPTAVRSSGPECQRIRQRLLRPYRTKAPPPAP
ncbi:MAG TPA: FtsX-like permease family protein [Thermoanaerobaculia bacterium]|nr:FtsX-like permease family protein [Thermoanaerobaculia bacterium]